MQAGHLRFYRLDMVQLKEQVQDPGKESPPRVLSDVVVSEAATSQQISWQHPVTLR